MIQRLKRLSTKELETLSTSISSKDYLHVILSSLGFLVRKTLPKLLRNHLQAEETFTLLYSRCMRFPK